MNKGGRAKGGLTGLGIVGRTLSGRRNSSTDWSRRSITSENNWFGEILAARTSGNAGPEVPYGQLRASENRNPGLRRRRWS